MFPVEISDQAQALLRSMVARKGGQNSVVRVGVKGGGCSGLEYLLRIDESVREGDLELNLEELTVVCDPKSAEYLQGSKLVLSGNLIGGGLFFENPNAARSCGCGTSFTPIETQSGKT